MKKIIYVHIIIAILLMILFSCSKDDETQNLATPSLEWKVNSLKDTNFLEVSVTINSEDELPDGELEFQIDDVTLNSFPITKGEKIYTTNYSFSDFEKHKASIVYTFTDGRNTIIKSINLKKTLLEVVENSSRNDWEDIN